MDDKQILAFLRIDVDAAGNDHEARAVGEIKGAVIVHITDVANCAHGAVGRACLRGANRIVEIFECRRGLEPQSTGRSGRTTGPEKDSALRSAATRR